MGDDVRSKRLAAARKLIEQVAAMMGPPDWGVVRPDDQVTMGALAAIKVHATLRTDRALWVVPDEQGGVVLKPETPERLSVFEQPELDYVDDDHGGAGRFVAARRKRPAREKDPREDARYEVFDCIRAALDYR